MIDELLNYNQQFVADKGYEKHITDGKPNMKLAIVTCMDTRLTLLLPDALGIKNGDAKIIKSAGGNLLSDYDNIIRSLLVAIYELGVKEIMVIHHSNCGACDMDAHHMIHLMKERGISDEAIAEASKHVNLETYLDGFHDTTASVRKTVNTIKNHPLIPKDIVVRGFIIDSRTGELTEQ